MIIKSSPQTKYASFLENKAPEKTLALEIEQAEKVQQQEFNQGYDEGYQQGNLAGMEQGKADGYQQGYAEGKAQAMTDAQQLVGAQMALFTETNSLLEQQIQNLNQQLVENVKSLAQALTFKLVDHQIQSNPKILGYWVVEALEQLDFTPSKVTIFLHQNDYQALKDTLGKVLFTAQDQVSWKISVSDKLAPGEVEVVTNSIDIFISYKKRLESLMDELF